MAFDPRCGVQFLELTSHDTESLVADLDRLPIFVTRLSTSHFSLGTIDGTDRIEFLIASDIGSFFAPNLSVTNGLHFHNVESVELASGGQLALLTGSKNTEISIRSLENT